MTYRLRVCVSFPNCPVPEKFPNFSGISRSRKFKTPYFPSRFISRHSRPPISRPVLFPAISRPFSRPIQDHFPPIQDKFGTNSGKMSLKIQYWPRKVLSSTEFSRKFSTEQEKSWAVPFFWVNSRPDGKFPSGTVCLVPSRIFPEFSRHFPWKQHCYKQVSSRYRENGKSTPVPSRPDPKKASTADP